jgi:hypothetical protein
MLKQLFVFIFLVVSLSPVFAKQATKSKKIYSKVNIQKIKAGFDAKYYYQLSYANRLKYLQEIQGFMVTASKGTKKKFKTSFYEEILLNFSVAEDKLCFSGGIPYISSTCGTLPGSFAINDYTISSCPSDSQRCSMGFGLSTDGKVLCYKNTDEGKATSICREQSAVATDGKTAVDRLNDQLTRCEPVRYSNSRCANLINSLEADTKALDTNACTAYPSLCKSMKERVEKLNRISTASSAATQAPLNDDGCAEAEEKLSQQMLGEKLSTQNINKKWLKLVSMSSNACPNGRDLESQLRKFGACTLPDSTESVEGDISNNSDLQAAIGALSSNGVYEVDSRQSNSFKRYFGVSPTEYKKLFCDSADTASFYKAVDKLPNARTAAESVTDVDSRILARLFMPENFNEIKASIQNVEFRNKFENYHSKLAEANRLRQDWLQCDEKGAGLCSDGKEKKAAFEAFDKANNIPNLKRSLESQVRNSQAKQDPRSRSSYLASMMGSSAYANAREAVIKSAEGVNGTVSPEVAEDRSEFKSCVNNAISKKEVDHENTFTSNFATNASRLPNGNRNKTCRRDLVADLIQRPSSSSGDIIVRLKTGSANIQNYSCHISDGRVYGPDKNGLGNCFKAIKISSNGSESFYCVDKPESYIAYGYKCNYASGNDLDLTPEEAADAAVK